MNKTPSLTIVLYGADMCNGSCQYCTGALDWNDKGLDLKQGLGKDKIASLKAIGNRLYQMIQFDFGAMEKRILQWPEFNKSDTVSFSIWGGDPLASFDAYMELYEFLHYIGDKYNKKITLGGSTNGLAFLQDDVAEFFLKTKDVHMQLSHDGIGQWIRTKDIDPLKIPAVEELFKTTMLRNINCNLSLLNANVKQNISYFQSFPFLDPTKHGIRLYTMRDERYEKATINTLGLLNGRVYEQLKNEPFIDLQVRNDVELAKKYDIFEFGHQADLLFDGYYWMYENINKVPLFKRPAITRIQQLLKHKSQNTDNVMEYKRPLCAQYHLGQSKMSNCIDTLGKETMCHLYDSRLTKMANPELKHPEKCTGCPYSKSYECNVCGRTDFSERDCQLNYRLNMMAEHFEYVTRNITNNVKG